MVGLCCFGKASVQPLDDMATFDVVAAGPNDKKPEETPSGTENLKQPWKKNESLLVVRPVGCTHLLTGHTILSCSIGEKIARRAWTWLFFGVLALLTVVVRVLVGMNEPAFTVPGRLGSPVKVNTVSISGLVARASCFLVTCILLWVFLHVVHRQLMLLSLTSFDPWVLTICGIRIQASHLHSRFMLTMDTFSLIADCVEFAYVMLGLWMVILLESCDLPRSLRKTLLLSAWAAVIGWLMYSHSQKEPANWDPDAAVDLLWLAPMQPRIQFRNALATIGVFLSKAAFNLLFKGRDFMFLHAHLQLNPARIDALFAELDTDSDGVIRYNEWSKVLASLGVPRSHIDAGFRRLDVGKDGFVCFDDFKTALASQILENPDMKHGHHLMLYCQIAFKEISGVEPLHDMLNTVITQWDQIDLHTFGMAVYQQLLDNETIAELFAGRNIQAQSLMFASFASLVLSKLRDGDLFKLDSEMFDLGSRHVGYHVHISQLSTFQVSMFAALQEQLGPAFLKAAGAWSFVWQHFFTAPFMRGWLSAANLSKQQLLVLVQPSLEWLKLDFDSMLQTMSTAMLGDGGSESQGGNASQDESMLGEQIKLLLSFLPGFVDLLLSQDRSRIRSEIHTLSDKLVEHHVPTIQVARFQEAFQSAARRLWQERFTETLAAAWSYIWQLEVIEQLHLDAFSDFEEKLDDLMNGSNKTELNIFDFMHLFWQLNLTKTVLLAGFERLNPNPEGFVSAASVRTALLTERMINPQCSLHQAMTRWCEHPDSDGRRRSKQSSTGCPKDASVGGDLEAASFTSRSRARRNTASAASAGSGCRATAPDNSN